MVVLASGAHRPSGDERGGAARSLAGRNGAELRFCGCGVVLGRQRAMQRAPGSAACALVSGFFLWHCWALLAVCLRSRPGTQLATGPGAKQVCHYGRADARVGGLDGRGRGAATGDGRGWEGEVGLQEARLAPLAGGRRGESVCVRDAETTRVRTRTGDGLNPLPARARTRQEERGAGQGKTRQASKQREGGKAICVGSPFGRGGFGGTAGQGSESGRGSFGTDSPMRRRATSAVRRVTRGVQSVARLR